MGFEGVFIDLLLKNTSEIQKSKDQNLVYAEY